MTVRHRMQRELLYFIYLLNLLLVPKYLKNYINILLPLNKEYKDELYFYLTTIVIIIYSCSTYNCFQANDKLSSIVANNG